MENGCEITPESSMTNLICDCDISTDAGFTSYFYKPSKIIISKIDPKCSSCYRTILFYFVGKALHNGQVSYFPCVMLHTVCIRNANTFSNYKWWIQSFQSCDLFFIYNFCLCPTENDQRYCFNRDCGPQAQIY